VEINHGDGEHPTTLKFNYSPKGNTPAAEIGGTIPRVDDVCLNLAGQFATAGHYENRFSKKVSDMEQRVSKQVSNVLDSTQRELKINRLAQEKMLEKMESYEARIAELERLLGLKREEVPKDVLKNYR
jgi:hypothetical protein